MTTEKLLTIVLTSYNHENYIEQAINSFLNQTFANFELIIVDDKSGDNSLNIIKKFTDPRIKIIALEKNSGVCNASNIGVASANGKYIKLFASDDIALPTMLEKQVNFLENNPSYDAIFSSLEVIDESGKILPKKTKKFAKFFTTQNRTKEEWLNHFFFKGNCLAAPTMMVKKELLEKVGGFDQRLSQAHDFDMWVKCCIHGSNIYVLDEKLVQYRRQNNNKNLSCNTCKVRTRLVFDNEKILQNFLHIKSVETLVKIFPNLQNLQQKITPNLIPFFIAQEALSADSAHHKQFALSTLYNLFANDEIKNILETQFNFAINKNFYDIVDKNPIGSMLEIVNRKPLYRRFFRSLANIFTIKTSS